MNNGLSRYNRTCSHFKEDEMEETIENKNFLLFYDSLLMFTFFLSLIPSVLIENNDFLLIYRLKKKNKKKKTK